MLGFLVLIGFAIHSIMLCVKECNLMYLFSSSLTASSEDIHKIFLVRKKRKERSEINGVHGFSLEKRRNTDSPSIFNTCSLIVFFLILRRNGIKKGQYIQDRKNKLYDMTGRTQLCCRVEGNSFDFWDWSVWEQSWSLVSPDNLILCWLFGCSKQADSGIFYFHFLLEVARQQPLICQ